MGSLTLQWPRNQTSAAWAKALSFVFIHESVATWNNFSALNATTDSVVLSCSDVQRRQINRVWTNAPSNECPLTFAQGHRIGLVRPTARAFTHQDWIKLKINVKGIQRDPDIWAQLPTLMLLIDSISENEPDTKRAWHGTNSWVSSVLFQRSQVDTQEVPERFRFENEASLCCDAAPYTAVS